MNPTPAPNADGVRHVVVNGQRLPDTYVAGFEAQFGQRIADGQYWYDSRCGAWGQIGGPTLGWLPAGLPVGGTLSPSASGASGTGVFINGRELHALDVQSLLQLGPVMPGRYWLDGAGNCGFENMPPFTNLFMLFRHASLSRGGASGGAWSHTTRDGSATVGGDGQGFTYFSGKDGTSYMSGG